jgi:hypothetical protein
MTRPSRPLAALLAALALAAQAPAQPPAAETREDRRQALLEGTHVLRRILHENGFTALESFDDLAGSPKKTLLVVLGDLGELAKVPGGLETFVRRGGALLAASDRAVEDRRAHQQLIAVSGVSINAETLICPQPRQCYRGKLFCPEVLPLDVDGPPFLFWQAGDREKPLLRVFTNVPSKLRLRQVVRRGVGPVAVLPRGCLLELPGGQRWPEEGHPYFAVAGGFGDGRVLVLADHSVFINEMMLPTDTNNVEFSYNAARWLRGDGGQRDRVLFVEDGKVQTRLDLPLKSVSVPPEEVLKMLFARRNELLVEGENLLAGLEDNDAFNRKLFDFIDPDRLTTLALVLGTLLGLLWLVYRLGVRGRFRHDTTVPLLAPAVGRNLPSAPLAEQRQEALLKGGNLWEPAAALARRWFARLGLEATPGGQPPAFEATGGWWQRRRLLGRLRRLWRLAAGRSRERVSPAELWRLQRELDELRAGWQRGAWRAAGTKPALGDSG